MTRVSERIAKEQAQGIATALVAEYGKDKALDIVRRKIQDAPFLVNGDKPFWDNVLNALEA